MNRYAEVQKRKKVHTFAGVPASVKKAVQKFERVYNKTDRQLLTQFENWHKAFPLRPFTKQEQYDIAALICSRNFDDIELPRHDAIYYDILWGLMAYWEYQISNKQKRQYHCERFIRENHL